MVLSACETALGDHEAELGFAGVSLESKVRTVIASLWRVNDQATSALMGEFYRNWANSDITTKGEALRLAQLSLLEGRARIENGVLVLDDRIIPLPAKFQNIDARDFSHPYFWAGFTAIGTPW